MYNLILAPEIISELFAFKLQLHQLSNTSLSNEASSTNESYTQGIE